MIEYLKNLVPRLQKFSKELDVIEVFVDKPWIYIDISGNHHEYVFMRDGRLLMSLNGIVNEGKWELLPTKRLLINRIVDQVMLNKMFINKDILMLQKNGTDNEPFVLINQDEIKDLNYLNYLKNLEQFLTDEEESLNNEPRITKNKKVAGFDIYVGMFLKTENEILISGTFCHISNENKFYEIINNKVEHIYYLIEYNYKVENEFKKIKLHVASKGLVQKGDSIINEGIIKFPINEFFEIRDNDNEELKIKLNHDLKITKVIDNDLISIFIFFGFVLFTIIIIVFLFK